MRTPDVERHFDTLAPAYAELRGVDDAFTSRLTEALARVAGLRGRSVLDVGCGSGRLLRELAARYGVRPLGVDRSAAMIEAARKELPPGVDLRVGRAEELPLADGEVERAVMTTAVHLFDRPRAFAELHRVLEAEGRVGISSPDPSEFDTYPVARFFPSYARIDRARFPTGGVLVAELESAGFGDVRCEPLALERAFTREQALAKLRGRAYSTFEFMDDEEYRRGVEAAEAALPDEVRYTLGLLIVSARR